MLFSADLFMTLHYSFTTVDMLIYMAMKTKMLIKDPHNAFPICLFDTPTVLLKCLHCVLCVFFCTFHTNTQRKYLDVNVMNVSVKN